MSQPVLEGWFSTKIRRNRKSYFLTNLALTGLFIPFGAIYLSLFPSIAGGSVDAFLLYQAFFMVIFIGSFGALGTLLAAQRLRDINISGWWALALFAGGFILDWAPPVLSLAGGILFLLAYLLLYFIPGTKGPNKYGPDPLKVKKAKS